MIPDFADYATYGSLAVFRLKTNGQPDSSFGQNGKKIFKSRNTDTVTNGLFCAVVQPDGKILMVVYQGEGPSQMYNPRDSTFLIRLNADGSFDNTFSGNGRKFLSAEDINSRLAVQPDGKIVLATTVTDGFGNYSTVVKRLNTDGSTDATFNNGADKVLSNQIVQVALQPNGKIVLCGYDNTVIRLTTAGANDNSFGTGGIKDVSAYYPNDGNNYISNMKTDSNRIVLMARFYDSTISDNYLKVVALQNNGQADSTFGQNGVVALDISTYPYAYEGLRMALQADKKVLITGFTDAANSPDLVDFALTRLKGNNSTATGRLYTFTGSGLWSNPTNWSDGTVPPTTLPAGSSVVIDPPAGSECVIDITVHVQAGATVTVRAGKQVRLPGNLIIQ